MVETCSCNLMQVVAQKPGNHLEWPNVNVIMFSGVSMEGYMLPTPLGKAKLIYSSCIWSVLSLKPKMWVGGHFSISFFRDFRCHKECK